MNTKLKTQIRLLTISHNLSIRQDRDLAEQIRDVVYEALAKSREYTTYDSSSFISDFENNYENHNKESLIEYLTLFCRLPIKESFYIADDKLSLDRINSAIKRAIIKDMPYLKTEQSKEYIINSKDLLNYLLEDGILKSKYIDPLYSLYMSPH